MPVNTIDDFKSTYREVTYWWEPLDRPILRACREMPDHTAVEDVFAKIALVNRTYRANLQMGTKRAEWKAAERFVQSGVDNRIAALRTAAPFSSTTLSLVLEAHENLVDILKPLTGRVENSFVAKYLSFHFPSVVPIFDRNAYATSWRLVGARIAGIPHPNWYNTKYQYHCAALLILINELVQDGVQAPSLKLIDNVLYDSFSGS